MYGVQENYWSTLLVAWVKINQLWVDDINFGSLPDWLAGVGGIAAAGIASWALRSALRANTYQNQQIRALESDRDRQQEQQVRAQAEKIAAWFDPKAEGGSKYRILNQSGQPVFGFHIWHIEDPKRGYPMIVTVLPPGEYYMEVYLEWLPPEAPTTYESETPVAYAFTDAARQNWRRDYDGTLRKLDAITYPENIKITRLKSVDHEEKRRLQANQVSAWADIVGGTSVYRISNSSRQPVYDAYFWHLDGTGEMLRVATVPPGEWFVEAMAVPDWGSVLDIIIGISVQYSFRDNTQNRWQRSRRGELREVHGPPAHSDKAYSTYLQPKPSE